MFCNYFFDHYCFIGTNIYTFLLQGIDKVLSIEKKETLGHTLHTLPQHWPTECNRYILSIGMNATLIYTYVSAGLQRLKVQGKVYASWCCLKQ